VRVGRGPEVLDEADSKYDVLVEATNSIGFAADVCELALKRKKHVVLMNAEVDLALGPWLHQLAADNNVVLMSGLQSSPADHAVLLVEITCSIGDDFWNDSPSARDQLLRDLEQAGVVDREGIVQIHHQRTQFGYPVFDLDFERQVATVQSYLSSFDNVDSIGRQGGFCYPNMHQTMRFGAVAAERLIARWQVG
jgi:predicted homoserine dehydrogenase-like protein